MSENFSEPILNKIHSSLILVKNLQKFSFIQNKDAYLVLVKSINMGKILKNYTVQFYSYMVKKLGIFTFSQLMLPGLLIFYNSAKKERFRKSNTVLMEAYFLI